MSWDRAAAATAIVNTLTAATAADSPSPSIFDRPPATFNVPAYIVAHPQTVVYGGPAFGIDLATVPLICAAGMEDVDTVDQLLDLASDSLPADPTLGGVIQNIDATEQRNWRVINVAGADYLTADLILEIRM